MYRHIFTVLAVVAALFSGYAVVAITDAERNAERQANLASFETCPRQRADAVACARRYGDSDGDGMITAAEIDAVIARYLTIPERTLVWLAQKLGLEDTRTVLAHCDADQDGRISQQDFEASADTCLKDCGRVMKFFKFVCERAERADSESKHARRPKH